jgi:hypothetical protein
MERKKKSRDISHLSCREAQAPLVAALIQGFAQAVGEAEALEVAAEVIRRDATRAGQALAEGYSGNSLATLLRIVEEVWANDGTMEIANVELTEETLSFDVTACGYAEMYDRLGLRELGCLLSCDRDFPFMEGFNPEIELQRTQTIMGGAGHCDFRYQERAARTNHDG